MKNVVTMVLLIALLPYVPTFAESELSVDKNMVQTEPGYVNHPSVSVLSFLVGRWRGEEGSIKIEENWMPESDGSMIVVRKKTFPDHKVETQLLLFESGPHGTGGRSQSFDYNLKNTNMKGIAQSVRLNAYSSDRAEFEVVSDSNTTKAIYKKTTNDVITIDSGLKKIELKRVTD